jgi:hypothetical protein
MRTPQGMNGRHRRVEVVNRRHFLGLAATSAAALALPRAAGAGGRHTVLEGNGRIFENVPGVTIPSPSDFGFSADPTGGFFLCSMFGSATGGWRGCTLMTLQGIVAPGTLEIRRGAATFSGTIDAFVFPNVFVNPPEPYLNAAGVGYTANVKLGGPGTARLVLHIPVFTETLGGDTGGILQFGRIERKRVQRLRG